MATPLAIVAYLALFAAVGFGFLFANLLLGRFMRPVLPNKEKLEVYECGEPTIGSSFVQFDLRFYVVALLFIIFDVEVAFFFPWATVFGKATQLAAWPDPPAATAPADGTAWSTDLATRIRELGVVDTGVESLAAVRTAGSKIALVSLADIGVFFAVLMVGFAYVWRRGDLDWVRAVRTNEGEIVQRPPLTLEIEPTSTSTRGASVLSA